MSAPRLRVALVSREYPPFFGGGIGTYAKWIVPALNAAGVRVHVITEAHDSTNPRVEIDGLTTVHRIPVGMGRGGWTNAAARFSIGAGRKVAQLHRAGEIHIAEFAEYEAAGAALLLLRAAEPRVPTTVQLHTPSEQLFVLRSHTTRTLNASMASYFEFERMALRLTDAVLAPSAFIADWAHGHYGLSVRPSVIPYAAGGFDAPPPHQTAPATGDESIVFYAGRIEPRKGVESLILAWNDVSRVRPGARLHLAGADTSGAPDGGSMRAYLLELLEGPARESVKFLGRLNSDALRREYGRAGICVIPSLWENFPNTCIESMASARAVLVGDAGGMKEMIGDTDAGHTFISGDPRDLGEKLIGLLSESPDALARRGASARARILEMCDPARIARLRIGHYRSVIESRHAPHDQAGVKNVWKGIERTLSGDLSGIGLPGLSESVARWVEREGAVS